MPNKLYCYGNIYHIAFAHLFLFWLAGSLLLLEWIKTLEELRNFSSIEIFLVDSLKVKSLNKIHFLWK